MNNNKQFQKLILVKFIPKPYQDSPEECVCIAANEDIANKQIEILKKNHSCYAEHVGRFDLEELNYINETNGLLQIN